MQGPDGAAVAMTPDEARAESGRCYCVCCQARTVFRVDERRRKEQLERLKVLDELAADQQRLLDRSLITLASGSFGLSLIFANAIAPEPSSEWLLAVAWLGFAVSIVATLISFRASADATEAVAEHERIAMRDDREVDAAVVKLWGKVVNSWNTAAIATFVVGVITLVTFAGINLLC